MADNIVLRRSKPQAEAVALLKSMTPEENAAVAMVAQETGITSADTKPVVEITGKRGWNAGVTLEAIKKRNDFIVGLRMMGMTFRTIRENVNAQAQIQEWGVLETDDRIQRIVRDHYMKNVDQMGREKDIAMKAALYESMELTLEKMVTYVRTRSQSKDPKDRWGKFEYMAAMAEIAKVQQLLMENMNWNASKTNPTFVNITQNTQNNITVAGADAVAALQRTPEQEALLQKIKASLKKDDESSQQ